MISCLFILFTITSSMRLQIIKASGNNYEVGYEIGSKLKSRIKILSQKSLPKIKNYNKKITPFLKYTKRKYPELIEELKGLSDGSDISFELMFAFNCREAFENKYERCTTIVDPDRKIIAHNEDWNGDISNIYILKAKIKNLKIISLNYALELSGTSVAVTADIIQTINDLSSNDMQIGIPKNFIARKILETKSIEEIESVLNSKRASGFNHIIKTHEGFFNIETTSKKYFIEKIEEKFTHTNHYLSMLREFEATKSKTTKIRLKRSIELLKTKQYMKILSTKPVLSKRTLASVIIKENSILVKPNRINENYRKYNTNL